MYRVTQKMICVIPTPCYARRKRARAMACSEVTRSSAGSSSPSRLSREACGAHGAVRCSKKLCCRVTFLSARSEASLMMRDAALLMPLLLNPCCRCPDVLMREELFNRLPPMRSMLLLMRVAAYVDVASC